jgi:hypothetical protein
VQSVSSACMTLTLVHAFVTSRVDYCNVVFSGCPEYSLNNLQSILNAAARLVYNKHKFDHIGPLLSELHWLPIPQRIDYKVAVITYKCLRENGPIYLQNMILPSAQNNHRPGLRSAEHGCIVAPRHRRRQLM